MTRTQKECAASEGEDERRVGRTCVVIPRVIAIVVSSARRDLKTAALAMRILSVWRLAIEARLHGILRAVSARARKCAEQNAP